MNYPVYDMVNALVEIYKTEEIAVKTNVSGTTVNRWIQQKSKPQPRQESIIREMYIEYMRNNDSINTVIDRCLINLREILHKSSRFSSRNEALEEIAKLFFAHIMAKLQGEVGIENGLLTDESKAAETLIHFVDEQFKQYKRSSDTFDFSYELRIKPSENKFALEIIEVFNNAFCKSNLSEQIVGIDVLNEIFGKFLADSFVDEKQLGQYLTPQEIVGFLNDLVFCDLDKDSVIDADFGYALDPCCGVGSFLAAFTDKVYSQLKNRPDASQIIKSFISNNVMGIDKSERMIKLALINMSMFGCNDVKLYLKNALDPQGVDLDNKVSVILTNPPFGAEFPANELNDFEIVSSWCETKPKKVNSEVLFLERYIRWLKPGGLLACVVPDSILNNKGIYESLRRGISKSVTIKAVISLPQNTFATTGTETKTSLLYLKKAPYNPLNKAYMAICSNNGYDVVTIGSQKTKKYNNSSDLHGILDDYRKGQENHGQWIEGLNECQRWDATYHVSLSGYMKKRIAESDLIRVKDVAMLTNERFNPKRFEANKTFNYIEISDVDPNNMRAYGKEVLCSEAPSRARKIVRENDIIFSTVRPERGIVAVISDKQDSCVCTTGFAVLRTRVMAPMVLSYLLQSEFVIAQIKKYSMGISYPAIDEKDLLEIKLPITDTKLEDYDEIAQQLINMEKQVSELRRVFKNSIETNLITV